MNNREKMNKRYGFSESLSQSKRFLDKYYFDIDKAFSYNENNKLHFKEIGGCVFTEEEFKNLKKFMFSNNDTSFYLIELNNNDGYGFNFKFPVDLKWNEMKNGGGISYELFRPIRKYLIITDNKNWYRIIDNDAISPNQITYATTKFILEKIKNYL